MEKLKHKKPQYCNFCEFMCDDFPKLSDQLIFCNWMSKRMTIKVVFEDDLEIYDRIIKR
jgi:hypothetical protein